MGCCEVKDNGSEHLLRVLFEIKLWDTLPEKFEEKISSMDINAIHKEIKANFTSDVFPKTLENIYQLILRHSKDTTVHMLSFYLMSFFSHHSKDQAKHFYELVSKLNEGNIMTIDVLKYWLKRFFTFNLIEVTKCIKDSIELDQVKERENKLRDINTLLEETLTEKNIDEEIKYLTEMLEFFLSKGIKLEEAFTKMGEGRLLLSNTHILRFYLNKYSQQ